MAMKKCKECGEEISSSAKKCPKCGKDQRNFFMKHPVLYTILILVVLGLFIGGSDKTTNTAKTTLTTGENEVVSSATTSDNTETKTPEKKSYIVGEIYEDNYMAIKYVSVDDDFKGYSKYADIKSGYKVIKAEFEFENVSTTDQLASSYDFTCYADGYDCESFYSVDDSSFSSSLSVGKKTKGNVYFEVPIDATRIVIEYETDYWNSEHIEFVVK